MNAIDAAWLCNERLHARGGGWDLTKTVRYGHLSTNPRATIVIDDLASTDSHSLPAGSRSEGPPPWRTPVGPSVSAFARTTIWSGGINKDAPTHFAGVENRQIPLPIDRLSSPAGPLTPRFSDEDDGPLA